MSLSVSSFRANLTRFWSYTDALQKETVDDGVRFQCSSSAHRHHGLLNPGIIKRQEKLHFSSHILDCLHQNMVPKNYPKEHTPFLLSSEPSPTVQSTTQRATEMPCLCLRSAAQWDPQGLVRGTGRTGELALYLPTYGSCSLNSPLQRPKYAEAGLCNAYYKNLSKD